MADFLLSVGVDVGLSYEQMQTDIATLVSRLNSNPPKIKVAFDIDNAAIQQLQTQISDISNSLRGTGVVNVGTVGAGTIAADMSSVAANAGRAANETRSANAAFRQTQTTVKTLSKGSKEYYDALKRVQTLLSQVTSNQEKWTAAKNGKSSSAYNDLSMYAGELQNLITDLQSGALSVDDFKRRMAELSSGVTDTNAQIKAAGENTRTFGERIGGLSAKFGTWFSLTRVIMAAYRAVRQMVTAVIDVDTAMTELRKVTDETEERYIKVLDNATQRAKTLGATLSDAVTATADFARLGYSIDEAEKLADAAIIYKNVGDGIEDINTASESIIATMQAFGVGAEQAMQIVDKFNEVGNNYAISSKGVGDALLRSAAAMNAANNSLDETIALAAAANTIVQDPEKVGTTLKTMSMYLRAAKTEAEDAGESTDGMAGSVSELRKEILALTGNKVDIQLDEDTFKSTYQILQELSKVWGELTDVSQANILEMIGGKRNSNVVAALLENFSVAENALETSADAASSALAENEKYLESINGKIAQFKATFETFSQNLIGSDLVKLIVDIGTGIIKVLDGLQRLNLLLPSIITFATIIKGIELSKQLSITTKTLIDNKAATESLIASVAKLTVAQKKRLAEDIKAAVASGALTKEQGAQILTTLGLATADGTLTIANRGLAVSFKSLMASIPVWGWVALGISVVIEGVLALTSAVNGAGEEFEALNTEFEQTISEIKTLSDNFSNLKSNLDDTVPRFVELASGVNELGKNVSLTDKQYEEFLQLNNKIAEMFPELNLGMDENGNYMLALSYSSDTLKNSLYELLEVQRLVTAEEMAKKMPTVLDDIIKIEKGYRDDIKEIEADMSRIKSGSFVRSTNGDAQSVIADSQSIQEYDDYIEFLRDKGIEVTSSVEDVIGTTGTIYTATWDAASSQAQNALAGYEKEIDNLEVRIKSKWKQSNASVSAWLQSDFLYNDMGSNMQDIAKAMVSGMDFNDLGLVGDSGEETAENIQSYITKYIINPLYSASPEIKDAFETAMSELASGDITTAEFSDKIKAAFENLLAGMDESEIANFKKSFIAGFNAMGIEGNNFGTVVNGLIENWIGLAGAANDATEDVTESVNTFIQALSAVQKLENGLEQLDKIYADVFNGEDFDFGSILGNADFEEAFSGLGDVYDDFIKTIANSPSDINACQEAFNNLAAEYLTNSEILKDVTDDTRKATIAMLEQMGIANASAIVDEQLAISKEKVRIESQLQADASLADVLKLYDEETATRLTAQAIYELAIAKIQTNENGIKTANDIEQLEALAQAAGASVESLSNLAKAKMWYANADKARDNAKFHREHLGDSHWLVKSWENVANVATEKGDEYLNKKLVYNIEFEYAGGSSTDSEKSAAEKAAEKEAKEAETWFERQLKDHQHLVAMERETEEDYLTWLNSAYQKAYKEGIIELDDYYKYQEEVYEGLRDIFQDGLADVEHEISMRENYDGESKHIIQLYEDLISEVEKEIQDARAQGLTDTDDYIQKLQGKWQDYTTAIKDIREEITDGAKDALDELIDYRVDMLKQEIEDEKDALNKKLDYLKEFYDEQKEMLQDQYDEEKYLEDQSEKRKTVSDIKAELAMLSNDDSAWAQKRKLELQEELSVAEDDLADFEKENALDKALDAIDAAYNSQESQIEREMEALDEKLNDPNALFNQALDDIRNNSKNQLYYQMLMYNRQYGDGNDETVRELWESTYGALNEYEQLFGSLYKGVSLKNETGSKGNNGWDSAPVSASNNGNPNTSSQKKPTTSTATTGQGNSASSPSTKSTAPSLANGSSVTVKSTATHFGAKSGGAKMASFIPGGSYTVYQTSGNEVLIGRNGVYTGWVKKSDIVGYASGTHNATAGLHSLDELGSEYLFTSSDGTNYRVLNSGDKVLNAKATDFLYEFANGGSEILEKIIKSAFGTSPFDHIQPAVNHNAIDMGGIIVQGNADARTVSEIRRAQRDNLTEMLKSLNNLNK